MSSTNLCNGRVFPGLLCRFFFFSFFLFFFSIHPQVLHNQKREYENDLLASIDPEQPVSKRTNHMEIESEISEPRY